MTPPWCHRLLAWLPESPFLPQTVFLAVGAVAGLLFVLATPPFGGADEPAHWRRAYQISEGALRAERRGDQVGGVLPASVKARRGPLLPNQRAFVDFRQSAVYPPIPYLPHALAIRLGRAVNMPPVILLYAARMAGLATSLGFVFLAIRITPIAKRLFLLLALTPMAIRQMSMVTADSVTNGASLLLLAMLLRLSLTPGAPPAGSAVASVVVCSLAVSLSKMAYLPLAWLYFLCPTHKLGGGRRYALAFLVLAGLSVAALAGWFWAIRDLYLPQAIAPTADPGRQTAFILAHPLRYAHVLVADLHDNWETLLWQCTGHIGHLPQVFGWLHLGVAAAVALVDGRDDIALDFRAKALIVLVCASTYALINTMNYLGWNPVGATTVRFVQGRYYIPIAALPFLLLSNRRLASSLPERRLTSLAACFSVVSALVAIRYLLQRWYGI